MDVKRTFTGEMKALKRILMSRAVYQPMVETATPGHEALVFGLLSTATVLSNQLMNTFDILDKSDIEEDSIDFRQSWSCYQSAITAIMLMALIVMPLFPRHEAQARAMFHPLNV
eukprot:Nk52_evm15s1485 gene=Nk52_evmTU15s1485